MFLLFPHFTFLGPIFSVSLECSCCSLILFSLSNIFSFNRMFLLFPHFTFLGPIFSVSIECSCCSLILLSLAQYFQFHSNVLAVPSFYFHWPNIFSFNRMFLLFPHFTFIGPIFSVSIECSCCSLILLSLTQYFQFHSNVLAVPSFYFP